tara:strand:+ start:646 stop:846 length:201 start_codon:yes stop_codon:yes gene_type:complete
MPSTIIKTQPKINTSFPKSKQEMYKRLVRESNTTFVPTATLLRNYAEVGMKIKDKEQLESILSGTN